MMSLEGPKLIATTPAANATDVSPTTALVLEFSSAVDAGALSVTLSPAVALSSASWNDGSTIATFTHDVPLDFATAYTVRVNQDELTFTTAAAPEMTPPTLVSSTPANAASGVDPSTALTLVFSESMDRASVVVTSTPAFDWGTPVWSAGDSTATFTASAPLLDSTDYTLAIAGADLAGNALGSTSVSFTTATPADLTPPAVVSTTPLPSVTFSEPMASATMVVSPDAGCTIALDPSATLLSCTPSAPLAPATTFTVTVPAAQARDLAMNPLAQDYTFMFTTPSVPDTTPPQLLSMTPDGGRGWPRTQALIAVFSEPMDRAATQSAVQLSVPTGKQLFKTWNDAGTTLTVIVDGGFAYGDQPSWTVGATASDLAGNALGTTHSVGFSIRNQCMSILRPVSNGYAVSSSFGSLPPDYGYNSSGNIDVGRKAATFSSSLDRGVLAFPFAASDAGCSSGAIGNVLGFTTVQLLVSEGSITGTPYAGADAGVMVDYVPWAPGIDAGVIFNTASPCTDPACVQVMRSPTQTGLKTFDVMKMADSVRTNEVRGPGYTFTLRLTNPYAESLGSSSPNYATFQVNADYRIGPTLFVNWEYP